MTVMPPTCFFAHSCQCECMQAWAVLYGVIGYASYLVGKSAGWGSRPMVLYGGQLALNLAWQPLFFLLKRPGVAQVDNAGANPQRSLKSFVTASAAYAYASCAVSGRAPCWGKIRATCIQGESWGAD